MPAARTCPSRRLAALLLALAACTAPRGGTPVPKPETTATAPSAPAASAAAAAPASPAAPAATAPIALDALPLDQSLPVTLSGATVVSDVTRTACLYSEWVTGERDAASGEWTTFRTGASETQELQVHTAQGVVTLRPVRLRLHLAPAWTGTHEGEQVAEYRLEAGKTYHGLVQVERYHLPPEGPGQAPVAQKAYVLALAETPWQDGRVPQPLTPRGRQHTY